MGSQSSVLRRVRDKGHQRLTSTRELFEQETITELLHRQDLYALQSLHLADSNLDKLRGHQKAGSAEAFTELPLSRRGALSSLLQYDPGLCLSCCFSKSMRVPSGAHVAQDTRQRAELFLKLAPTTSFLTLKESLPCTCFLLDRALAVLCPAASFSHLESEKINSAVVEVANA